jgi:acetyltransferase-like isoleucine patch superfamily enzyme
MFENEGFLRRTFKRVWIHFWMSLAGTNGFGRFATGLAGWLAPPHKARTSLARMNPRGYVAPSAVIYHPDLKLGKHIFIADRVIAYQAKDGGFIRLGDNVCILRDSILETGFGGSLSIGDRTWIHPRCQLNAYLGSIEIGSEVQIAPNCAFYSYDHGFVSDRSINKQPLETKGNIIVEDGVWFGVGVIVLSGVRIGKGAVIGAGSVVTQSIPPNAIAIGVPARVIKMRSES